MSLEKKNSHPRDSNIEFYEGPHIYTLNGSTIKFTSVTTLVHLQFEQFNADKILNNIFNKNPIPEKYHGKTKESVKAEWEENRDSAASAGTKLHQNIEDYFNGRHVNNESIEWKYFLKFHTDNLQLKPYRTEWVVYDESIKIAGSIDMVTENPDHTLTIYDWKRSKAILKSNSFNKFSTSQTIGHIPDSNFWHYSLQLNIYKSIIERQYNKTVKDLFLVCLHPNHSTYQLIKCPDLQCEVSQLFAELK
jgi:ATP-dependent exoDNAse (exonuclease V) beta subunit